MRILNMEKITFGYEHWSGKPVDDQHQLELVPQTIADGWQGFCSCGQWGAFASFYDYAERDRLLDALRAAHKEHRP